MISQAALVTLTVFAGGIFIPFDEVRTLERSLGHFVKARTRLQCFICFDELFLAIPPRDTLQETVPE